MSDNTCIVFSCMFSYMSFNFSGSTKKRRNFHGHAAMQTSGPFTSPEELPKIHQIQRQNARSSAFSQIDKGKAVVSMRGRTFFFFWFVERLALHDFYSFLHVADGCNVMYSRELLMKLRRLFT